MKRLIMFLIRIRLGVRLFQGFQFNNQKTSAIYYFTPTGLMKTLNGVTTLSNVSLNWILSDKCMINRAIYNTIP